MSNSGVSRRHLIHRCRATLVHVHCGVRCAPVVCAVRCASGLVVCAVRCASGLLPRFGDCRHRAICCAYWPCVGHAPDGVAGAGRNELAGRVNDFPPVCIRHGHGLLLANCGGRPGAHGKRLPRASPFGAPALAPRAEPTAARRSVWVRRGVDGAPRLFFMRGALRAWFLDGLHTTYGTIDDLSGLPSGYCAKLFSPIPVHRFGKVSLGPLLGAAGLQIQLVIDEEQLECVRRHSKFRERG